MRKRRSEWHYAFNGIGTRRGWTECLICGVGRLPASETTVQHLPSDRRQASQAGEVLELTALITTAGSRPNTTRRLTICAPHRPWRRYLLCRSAVFRCAASMSEREKRREKPASRARRSLHILGLSKLLRMCMAGRGDDAVPRSGRLGISSCFPCRQQRSRFLPQIANGFDLRSQNRPHG